MTMGYSENTIPYGQTAYAMESESISIGLRFTSDGRGLTRKSRPFCPPPSTKVTQPVIKVPIISKPKTVYSAKGNVSTGLRFGSDVKGHRPLCNPFWSQYETKIPKPLIRGDMASHYKNIINAKSAIDNSEPKSFLASMKNKDRIKLKQLKIKSRPQSASSHPLRSRIASSSAQVSHSRGSLHHDDVPYVCSRTNTPFTSNKLVHSLRNSNASEMASQQRQTRNMSKTFKGPVKNTYCGDIVQRHAHRFKPDKQFTPKLLKSEASSTLATYRYYRRPIMKTPVPEADHSLAKSWDNFIFNESESATTVDGKTSNEQLEYLQFISDITQDILSSSHITDSLITQVYQFHLDSNLHRLDEDKMRRILKALQFDINQPREVSTPWGFLETTDITGTTEATNATLHEEDQAEDLALTLSQSLHIDTSLENSSLNEDGF